MPSQGPRPSSHIVPLMRYRDVGVASEWLCAVFGFAPHFAAKAPDGAVFYAELQAGESMIMLGAVGEPSLDAVMREPASAGHGPTQSCYVVVEDVRGHYAHAKEAGAEIVLDLKSDDRGGAGYSCKDPEGHVWNFGSYDPRTAQGASTRRPRPATRRGRGMATATVLTVVLSVISGWYVYDQVRGGEGLSMERLRQAILGATERGLATGTIAPSDQDGQAARAEATRAHKAMAALKEELERERRAKAQALAAAAAARVEVGEAAEDKAHLEARAKASEAALLATDGAQGAARDIQAARGAAERSETALKELRGELKSMQETLHQAQEAQRAAEAARSEAQASVTQERQEKEAALKALADAGARIATLEQRMSAAKSATADRSLKRMRAISAVRSKPRPKQNKTELNWPYSSW